MATIDVGKIKFTWKGAFATGTTYEKDDVVSYASSSWVYVNAAAKTGTAAGAPTNANSAHWNVMAAGSNPLTTQGDILTHDGNGTVRLARGNAGQVLTVSGNDVVFGNVQQTNVQSDKYLLPNYDQVVAHNASNTYGASGSRAWLADYANNWVPECGIPNPAMGPVMFPSNHIYGKYRSTVYLNQNHEVVTWGFDEYFFGGASAGNKGKTGTSVPIFHEYGGLADGEYFVRLWCTGGVLACLTNKGSLFMAGYNGYGQLGTGNTTHYYGLVKVPCFGPGKTHNNLGTRIVGFHLSDGGDGYRNYNRCFAIDENLRLFAWGYGASNGLGTGSTANQSRPQLIDQVDDVMMVQSGYQSSAIVDTDRKLYFTGSNGHGHFGDGSTTSRSVFTQTTAASDVYQFNIITAVYYTTSWTWDGTSHYLNTSGELYGAGENGNGQVGDGTTTDKNGFTRAGSSITFSSFYYTGNSRDLSCAGIGGTPGGMLTSGAQVYTWGYNATGACGNGTTTTVNSPSGPGTATLYTNTCSSTDCEGAPTSTAVAFPQTNILQVWPAKGINGQNTGQWYMRDGDGRIWKFGYNSNTEYYRNLTANIVLNKPRLDAAPWNTTESFSADHFWSGQVSRKVIAFQGVGYSYSSAGTQYAYMSDGTIFGIGYNAQGQLDEDDAFTGTWTQIN
jgi:alpha-tubulin suppressor-like RCC1 family protein